MLTSQRRARRGDGCPGVPPPPERQLIGTVNWIFTPKLAGKPLNGLTIPFNGTRQEAFTRARNLAAGLVGLLRDTRFSVRVDRTDRAAKGYEVGPDGHTIE